MRGDFSRAASADPGFMPALEALSESTEEQEINRRPQLALAAFRRGLDTEAATDPLFHLYRGRLERSFGSVERSLDAFDTGPISRPSPMTACCRRSTALVERRAPPS